VTGAMASQETTDREWGKTRSDKRARILDAAITVFARSGYHGARVSDIAREAGIAYGLVYHYFRNKEEILASAFEERWGDFLAVVDAIAQGGQPARQKLRLPPAPRRKRRILVTLDPTLAVPHGLAVPNEKVTWHGLRTQRTYAGGLRKSEPSGPSLPHYLGFAQAAQKGPGARRGAAARARRTGGTPQ